MLRRSIAIILMVMLLIPELLEASELTIETPQLIVSDATSKLSNEQLKRLADHAQEILSRALAF